MKLYKIADLEQLTGIKAHTIRIWEKRYNLIEPIRTETNIRRYNDEQVKKLLNVSTLLANGMKISKIAEMGETKISAKVSSLQQNAPGDVIVLAYINELTDAMIRLDETAFEKSFSAAVNRFGLYESMLRVFYPLLFKIGVMWSASNISPYQEHFASSVIRRKLMSAIDGLPLPKKRKRFLLFLPQDEYHEIALLFSDYIIRSAGYETIYLGPNVPAENIKEILKVKKSDYILTFFITGSKTNGAEIIKNYTGFKDVQLLVSGSPGLLETVKKQKNLNILTSPEDLKRYL